MFAKISRCKYAIVGPNVFDQNVVVVCKGFESFFGLQCFFGCSHFLKMTIKKLCMMINPESAVFVLAIGCSSGLKRYVAANARDHLVHRHEITRSCNISSKGSSSTMVRMLFERAIKASRAQGCFAVSKMGTQAM